MGKRSDDQTRIHVLFHQAWGQAKDSPSYDKEVWKELDNFLVQITRPGSPYMPIAPDPGETVQAKAPLLTCPDHPDAKVAPVWHSLRNTYVHSCEECGLTIENVKSA